MKNKLNQYSNSMNLAIVLFMIFAINSKPFLKVRKERPMKCPNFYSKKFSMATASTFIVRVKTSDRDNKDFLDVCIGKQLW